MKWFKHFSDANRDPKLISLIDEFGLEGYGMWWVICEVIADQYQADGLPEIETSDKGWRKLTGIYPQKFKKVVTFLEKARLLSVTFSEKGTKVSLPKMQEFKDNHTRNLQATYKQEVEEEEEEEVEKIEPPLPPVGVVPVVSLYSDSFESFWKMYPKKIGKGAAYKSWQKIGKKKDASVSAIMTALKAQTESRHFANDKGEMFIPNPQTWLNQRRWEDEITQPAAGLPERTRKNLAVMKKLMDED